MDVEDFAENLDVLMKLKNLKVWLFDSNMYSAEHSMWARRIHEGFEALFLDLYELVSWFFLTYILYEFVYYIDKLFMLISRIYDFVAWIFVTNVYDFFNDFSTTLMKVPLIKKYCSFELLTGDPYRPLLGSRWNFLNSTELLENKFFGNFGSELNWESLVNKGAIVQIFKAKYYRFLGKS